MLLKESFKKFNPSISTALKAKLLLVPIPLFLISRVKSFEDDLDFDTHSSSVGSDRPGPVRQTVMSSLPLLKTNDRTTNLSSGFVLDR